MNWVSYKKSLAKLSNKQKGDSFERLTQHYLKYEPQYATKLKEVWLLSEVPVKIHKKLNLPDQDQGIDLICETKDGEYWAVQSKYHDDETTDPNNKDTWYEAPRAELQMKELAGTGMVECYNNQHLWNNRMTQKVYDSFVDIWGTEKLWVTIDRANLNFPMRDGYKYNAFIHWDYDPDEKPVNVQGVLALGDQTDENMGGFQCIPELYRDFHTWKLTQPQDRDKFKPDTTEFNPVKVKMEAGDLLIFNSLLAHGIRENKSDKVRIAQYLSIFPGIYSPIS